MHKCHYQHKIYVHRRASAKESGENGKSAGERERKRLGGVSDGVG